MRDESPMVDENEKPSSPITRSMTRALRENKNKPLAQSNSQETSSKSGAQNVDEDEDMKQTFLRRMSSVRDAFGTLRQVNLNFIYTEDLQ